MIWFADKWSISVVDLRDLSQIIIENGLKAIMQQQGLDKIPEPVMTIADFSVNKILVVYNLEGKHLLVWHQENKQTEMWLAEEKFPQFQKITYLDITKDKKYGIVGGQAQGVITIGLFKFDTTMKFMASTNIPVSEDSVSSGVTGIRVSTARDGLMFVTTMDKLNILQIDVSGQGGVDLKIIQQVDLGRQLGTFCDICPVGKRLYLAGKNLNDGFLSLEFAQDI